MSNLRLRQQDIVSDKQLDNLCVTIIGCGGIGSHTALALARLGVKDIILYDADSVDEHNCASQGFDLDDIGELKVMATALKCTNAVGICPNIKPEFYKENTKSTISLDGKNVFILAVDTMEDRKEIFNAILNRFRGTFSMNNSLYIIDAGMGGEIFRLNTYTAGNFDNFEKSWFSDDDAVQEKCTAKATIYTTLLAAGFIAKAVKDIATDSDNLVLGMEFDIATNSPTYIKRKNGMA